MRSMGLQRLSALLLAFTGTVSVIGAQVQKSGLQLPADAATHRQEVVDMFSDTFAAYTYVFKVVLCSSARLILYLYAENTRMVMMILHPSGKLGFCFKLGLFLTLTLARPSLTVVTDGVLPSSTL